MTTETCRWPVVFARASHARVPNASLFLILAVLLSAGNAGADSIFSVNGLGEAVHLTDARGRGMGGTSIAVIDPQNQSPLNPAMLASVGRFTLHGEVTPELRSTQLRGDDGITRSTRPRSTNFPLLRVAVDLESLGVLGIGASQYTDVAYKLEESGLFEGSPFKRTLEGTNGWSTVHLGFARTLTPNFRVGVDVGIVIGNYLDIWTVDFEDPDAVTSVDSLIVNHSRGPRVRLGALYRPLPALAFGVTYMPATTFSLRREIRSNDKPQRFNESEIDLPSSFGLGTSYALSSQWLLASDVLWTSWSDTDITQVRRAATTEDVTRFSIGAEYVGDRSAEATGPSTFAWRAGYYREPWHYRDPFGERIIEQFVTAGVGIPFPSRKGYFQASVEIGRRGDLDLNRAREQVTRFAIGLTLFENVLIGRVE